MNGWILLTMLVSHYMGDFIAQSDWEAKNKSTNNKALNSHVLTYVLCWFPFAFSQLNIINAGLFLSITFLLHWITDYYTSKWVKKFFVRGDNHNGFCVIGFDQILHYVQLYLTFKMLN